MGVFAECEAELQRSDAERMVERPAETDGVAGKATQMRAVIGLDELGTVFEEA